MQKQSKNWPGVQYPLKVFTTVEICPNSQELLRAKVYTVKKEFVILYYWSKLTLVFLSSFSFFLFFFFFVTRLPKGWLPPPVNLKLTRLKYRCIGSSLSIDTKIMKIGQRMTLQWRNKAWPTWKCRFSTKYRPKLKKGSGVSNMFCKV